jgi:hypothetical protein
MAGLHMVHHHRFLIVQHWVIPRPHALMHHMFAMSQSVMLLVSQTIQAPMVTWGGSPGVKLYMDSGRRHLQVKDSGTHHLQVTLTPLMDSRARGNGRHRFRGHKHMEG